MARRVRCLWLWMALIVGPAVPGAWAAEPHAAGVLVTLAELSKSRTEGYRQYEAVVAWPLKWHWRWASGWRGGTELSATAGTLRLNGRSAMLASAGPLLALTAPGGRLVLHGGIRPTVLTRSQFDRVDLGFWLQFTSHVGIALHLGRGFLAGYRLQHMSNAALADRNPGVNLSTVELRRQW